MLIHVEFDSFDELPFSVSKCRCLFRFPIWEQHGGAVEPTARVIDDLLDGGQNSTTGMQYTHRPCDLDTWSSHCRATQERFPEDQIQQSLSDEQMQALKHKIEELGAKW